jgi:hypothetical protein
MRIKINYLGSDQNGWLKTNKQQQQMNIKILILD